MDTKHSADDLPVEDLLAGAADVDILSIAIVLDYDYDPIMALPKPVKTEDLVVDPVPPISQEECQTFLTKAGPIN
ncbi:hypothetical protein S7335_1135 [Synechococcus sp. PCC 7335]|uniref:hypothetical protein n=1 Tax=Synechococcus sp. (strain ATCC 29403 / PCC 7335) TaxID=91464 RepID=UPI00017EC821|nr:hypothetical protein [Synechococcus sp. PCC 7335]EDX82832.1 hypothetical protein S7335_1135 [Synechococcus sp. PCC 7335]